MKIKQRIMSVMLTMALALTVLCGTVFSVSAAGSTDENAFNADVGDTFCGGDFGTKNYTLDSKYASTDGEGSGYLTGAVIVDSSTGMVKSYEFKKLTNNSQREVITDLNSVAEDLLKSTDDNGNSYYTDEHYQNWVQQLQNCDGVGSRLISTLMANTKPDFASANRIYQPFSGTVGTVLGLVAVLLMAALAIVMVLDLSYIAVPFVRNLLDGGSSDTGSGNGGIKSKFVSWEAYNAVQQVEAGGGNGGNDGGDNKTAVGIYFKKRIIMLLILGLCLLYLVQGEIFTMVGWFMDLVSGLLPTS